MRQRSLRIATAIMCTAAGVAAPLPAQQKTTSESIQALLGDSAQYRQVITAFQHAVKTHDDAAVAALVNYPIKVTIKGTKRIIKGPQKFIAKYDSIITPAIAAVVQDEKYDAMMVNSRGVMLGRGEVWINGTCRDKDCRTAVVRVITIQSTADLDPAPGAGK